MIESLASAFAPLAEINWSTLAVRTLTPALVLLLAGCIVRSARRPVTPVRGELTLAYPWPLRVFVILGWLGCLGFLAGALLSGKERQVVHVLPLIALFAALLAPLHLETFGVRIICDGACLHTQSPWRAPRTIPLHSVVSCDYSALWQWHRLRTRDHGIVRLHQYLRGTRELLARVRAAKPSEPVDPTLG